MEKQKKCNLPLILIIIDGWGLSEQKKGNAIALAKTPFFDSLFKKYPNTRLRAHGEYVGLPAGQDGNSEAGHMNIGAGRVVEQDAVKICKSINDSTFFKNTAFLEAIKNVKKNNSRMHLMGMLSNGMSAHSDPDHILALLTMLRGHGIDNACIHLFTDGRDSPKYVSLKLIEAMERDFLKKEKVATIMGRFYAMDRKKKWQRTEKVYEALVMGKGLSAGSPQAAITESYNKGENDEFIEPYIIKDKGKPLPRIGDEDSVIFFNLRSDRARQLAKVFVQKDFNGENPGSFKRKKVLKNLCFVAMTEFGPDLDDILTAFPGIDLRNTLAVLLSDFKQVYVSEEEKRAHITYFFNGGYAGKVNGEDYIVINSPDVRSYDQTPGMNSRELTKIVLRNLNKKKYDFTVLNFPAPDMVAHTGSLEAGIKCCQIIDKELELICKGYMKNNGTVLLVADHGNIEEMINLETGEIDTEHSINKVPFILVKNNMQKTKLRKKGSLCDVAPTILEILGVKRPKEMSGKSLIEN